MNFRFYCLTALTLLTASLAAADPAPTRTPPEPIGITSNPGAANIVTGTGDLGKLFTLKPPESALQIGGVWVADGDCILAGGTHEGRWSSNNLVILSLLFDTEKASWWKGGSFGAQFLQFNGMNSNARLGSVQGADGLPGPPPRNRSELYEAWFRQSLFEDKLILRLGKIIATYDFNNVVRPIPEVTASHNIPSVSGLIYTPIFINPANLGVMPGYYNSAYGVVATFAPVKRYYLSAGAYDGNLARGKQVGLEGPHFNGYYFYVAEVGAAWEAGSEHKPGLTAVGGWDQTGKLTLPDGTVQRGAQGAYLFGSQRLWFRHPNEDNSGVSAFWQLGWNRAKTLPVNGFLGGGLTAFGLTRPKDSFGMGLAYSKLNKRIFERRSELMIQGYYQAHLFFTVYLEPVITFVPTPGAAKNLPPSWMATLQAITLF